MSLTESQSIRHLLRRLGLGAGRYAMMRHGPLGSSGTIDALLRDDQVDEGFDISPWEFATHEDGRIDTVAYRLSEWWALRMLMTRRPFQERLTLFWHNHFTTDFEKVGELPTLAAYLEVLRSKGRGKFRDLLWAVFEQGASYIYLDQHLSNKIHPNENYARELLELFTLGIGNYTEQDVREAARALTGWCVHYIGTGAETDFETLRLRAAKAGIGVTNACYVPALHDDGPKTILGKTQNWSARPLMDMLAAHPKTAERICRKLWDWFGWGEPTADTARRMLSAWKRSDGEIRSVVRAIVDAPQFWAPECVGRKPKSPVDAVVSLYRSLGLGDALRSIRGPMPKTPYTPIKKELRETAGGLSHLMNLQGMFLLRPPDVAGWEGGFAWITPSISVERIKVSQALFWGGGDSRPAATWLAAKIRQEDNPASTGELVRALADILDVDLDPPSQAILEDVAARRGGLDALASQDPNRTAYLFAETTRAMLALPGFQLC